MRALTLTAALLALAACAAHESRVRVLTAGGFDETVASGRWLVELCVPCTGRGRWAGRSLAPRQLCAVVLPLQAIGARL